MGCVKAPGFDRRNRVNIGQYEPGCDNRIAGAFTLAMGRNFFGWALVGRAISFDRLERVKAPGLNDRKWVNIRIWTHLRSLNRGSFRAGPNPSL